ncbi:protein trichome birefringence-like 28 [Zingiber officinale]|uniref:Trichome birefringence-like N-terminal domain-containing protein n=1 Tax=Zingiber officinale TaxID=94328 RepID=A0A8J5G7U4_ZINOF|nr:protein trichome birefringence-like 28 [Zingiber officinale]KAG6500144.1 hypothetical protein ZIOFF_039960 [Zingiber officinale]
MHLPRRKSPLGPPSDVTLAVGKQVGSYARKGNNFSIYALVLAIFLLALIIYREELRAMAESSLSTYQPQEDAPVAFPGGSISRLPPETPEIAAANVTGLEKCDLARGEWVFDDVDFPMYWEEQCQYLSQQMSCSRNGRPESMYQKWRWQPAGCSLPKFDARTMLEWLKGKRMVFIGDSMNRNQWESFVCLMQTVVPPEARDRRVDGSRIIFTIKEHGASIEFYWAPFLVESNSDDPNIHNIAERIINPDAIEKHAVHWKGADVLVFNTYIWWMNTFETRVLRPGAQNWMEHEMIVRYQAYDRVLRTLTNWLDLNVDPTKTSVFFMSMSPTHSKSSDWGNRAGIKCAGERLPITDMTGVSVDTDMNIFALAKKALASPALRVPVTFVDITAMSERRKDAHTSVFTVRQGALLTLEQQAKPAEFADCIHWCLPGLPDTWNQLLFVHLLSGRRSRY